MKADQENTRLLFAFAGLWRHQQVEMQDPDTDRDTYTVITTMANAPIKPTHPTRLPVIFLSQSYNAWLHETEQDALSLLKPFPFDDMRIAKQDVVLWSDALCEQ